jgi:hypothetical protein
MIPVLAQDKANHAVYGSAIFTAAYVVAFFAGLPALPIAAGAVIGFGVGKEIYDKLHKDKHTPDPLDALATLAGGALCAIPLLCK